MQMFARWLWYLGPANPLFLRIIQGGSTRQQHLWVRMAYLGTLIVLVLFGLLTGGGMRGETTLTELAKAGSTVFSIVAYGQVILICLLAPLFLSGAISNQAGDNTLDILLATPLSNLQIVLGSLLGRLFFVLVLLASGIPLFAVLLILGGIPIDAVFVSFGTAALSALVMGAVAVTLSVMRTGGRKAVFIFVIAVAAYLVTGYALDLLLLRRMPVSPGGTTWLTPLHPILVLESYINRANYAPPLLEDVAQYGTVTQFYLMRPFAAFAVLTGLVSSVLVIWSAVRVRRLEPGGGQLRRALKRMLRLPTAQVGTERRRKPREVGSANPIAWREANTRGRLLSGLLAQWGFAVAGIGAVGLLLLLYHRLALPTIRDASGAMMPQDHVFRQGLLVLLMLELAVVTLVAIYMSAGCVSREREDGTLDLILTTPVTPKQYIWGKLRGLVSFLSLLLAVPVVSLAMVAVYTQIALWQRWPTAEVTYSFDGVSGRQPLMLIEAPILLALVLVPYVALCVTVGMHFSLKAKGVLGAVVPSVAILGLLAVVMGFCGLSFVHNVEIIGPIVNGFSPVTNLLMIVNPWESVQGFLASSLNGSHIGRASLVMAALMVAAGYGAIVYGWLLSMVASFDQTVRKLSGTG